MEYLGKLCIFFFVINACHGIETVTELNIDNYVGRWYQILENQWTKITNRERNNVCITATYTKLNETYVDVLNAGRDFEPMGPSVSIEGYAFVPNPAEPGALKVALDGVPVVGDYWVTLLGPLRNGQYQYSVVTDGNNARALYVLCRNVEDFKARYMNQVLSYLQTEGFVGRLKQPVKVLHTPNCIYPPGFP
ncbi:uncharacterized protein [Amphiura filiformis]|uniref:uncharacterized protein n=1 Tax=Amphiura filiformis TaxID=82378 RepID=UPI003B225E8D